MRCHLNTWIFLCAVLCLLIGVESSWGLAVKPALLDLQISPGQHQTGVITVGNPANSENRFRASVVHFRLNRNGQMQQAEPDSFAVQDWIKFNPREFTLAPNEQQQIRYTLIVPQDADVGDYWGALEFMPLTTETVTSHDSTHQTNVKLVVSSAIVVPIFVQIGDVDYKWSIMEMQAHEVGDNAEVAITLSNVGNGRVPFRTELDVVDSSGAVIAHQERGEISLFPFSERVVSLKVTDPIPIGMYTVRARVASDKANDMLAGETRFQKLEHP